MAGIKELKTRIRSIGSTRKITRAMQMVSAAKMRKAQNAVVNSRSYASLAWEMMENLGGMSHPHLTSPLPPSPRLWRAGKGEEEDKKTLQQVPSPQGGGQERGGKKIGVILLTSNRGLVGSLNTNLTGKMKEIDMTDRSDTTNTTYQPNETIAELITYGKKGQIIAAKLKKNIVADFPKFDRTISIEDIYPIAKFVSDAYNTGKYEKIVVIYNHFVSTLAQKPTVRQLLPFSTESVRRTAYSVAGNSELHAKRYTLNAIYEPSPQTVIDHLIPRIIESQIYQAILESDASEHSARMVMMKNATEASGDLISDLTLTYNQLRQGKITTELAEITAGRIALE